MKQYKKINATIGKREEVEIEETETSQVVNNRIYSIDSINQEIKQEQDEATRVGLRIKELQTKLLEIIKVVDKK